MLCDPFYFKKMALSAFLWTVKLINQERTNIKQHNSHSCESRKPEYKKMFCGFRVKHGRSTQQSFLRKQESKEQHKCSPDSVSSTEGQHNSHSCESRNPEYKKNVLWIPCQARKVSTTVIPAKAGIQERTQMFFGFRVKHGRSTQQSFLRKQESRI